MPLYLNRVTEVASRRQVECRPGPLAGRAAFHPTLNMLLFLRLQDLESHG